jgi:hypothetical protein
MRRMIRRRREEEGGQEGEQEGLKTCRTCSVDLRCVSITAILTNVSIKGTWQQ